MPLPIFVSAGIGVFFGADARLLGVNPFFDAELKGLRERQRALIIRLEVIGQKSAAIS